MMSETVDLDIAGEIVSGKELSRTERAAVFLMLLGDDEAAALMSRLEPQQLEAIGNAMIELGDVDQPLMAEALSDFVTEADREVFAARGREARIRSLFEKSLGSHKADHILERVVPEKTASSLEVARWLSPEVLASLVEEEHPQVIAVLLLMLEPELAAATLAKFPDAQQGRVVERIARMGPISSYSRKMIEGLLEQRIGAQFGAAAMVAGGPRDAANLINLAAGDTRNIVLPAIAERDEKLAEEIEEQLFTFEMLLDLGPQDMGRLLRDVDNSALIDALKGLPEEAREPFFAAMSSRAADGIRDEIEMRGRISRSEVEVAQRDLVTVAKSLVDQGEISIGADDGEFL